MAARPSHREAPPIVADVSIDMFGTLTIARVAKDEACDSTAARLPVPSFAMPVAIARRWADLAAVHQPALAAQVRAVLAQREAA